MSDEVVLTIDGLVERLLRLRFDDLDALPEPAHVADVSRFHPKRRGDGVTLDALLERSGVHPQANYTSLNADRDDFHLSVPLKSVREQGIVVYRLDDARLGIEDGGPIRFLIREPSVCHTGELDECVNVKGLSRIELTTLKGRDTRPTTDEEHAALHAPQLPGTRSRAEGDSRSEANKVRQDEGRSSRHPARGNPRGASVSSDRREQDHFAFSMAPLT